MALVGYPRTERAVAPAGELSAAAPVATPTITPLAMAAEIIITSRTRRSATGRYVTLRFDRGKATSSNVGNPRLSLLTYPSWRVLVAPLAQKRNDGTHERGIWGMSGQTD